MVKNPADSDLGQVLSFRQSLHGPELEIAWARARERRWHPLRALECGFCEQMWVEVSGPPRGPKEAGQILQFREIGGRTQALVEFVASGRRLWLPYQSLTRRVDIRERLLRGKFDTTCGAERFRLRCLAHGLEIWNENTGALSGVQIEPLPHQVSLVHHILASGHLNWMIADDVGLGKTIEVGLLIHAFLQRTIEARILIVCPAGLTRQWQEEMRFKFGLTEFDIYGLDFNIEYADQWYRRRCVIASIDRLKHPNHLERLKEVHHWDLVVFDEAHRLTRHERGNRYDTSERFRLAEALREVTESLLLLTATPHQGRDDLFRGLLGLLRPDLKTEINRLSQHPEILLDMVIRNPKNDVRHWTGEKIFKGKTVSAIKVNAPAGLQEFTRNLEGYFRRGYEQAKQLGAKGHAIGFVMTVYRKLAASSIHSIVAALERRLQRLVEGVIDTRTTERDEEERDSRYSGELEEQEAAASSAFFEGEARQLRDLINQGKALIPQDPKIQELLKGILPQIRSQARHEKVVIFTEYRSTQQYLQEKLRLAFGPSSVVLIHGSMSVEERRESIRKFEEIADFLISTEAGGEGINLQRKCHTMVNYDLPWNPTRLVQRVGRLYRYGQEHPVVVFNLHTQDTLDGEIVRQMYERLDKIVRDLSVLGGDFNEAYADEVFGQIAELADVESIFEQAYDRHRSTLDVEITEALNKAREIYEERKEIFNYFAQTLDIDSQAGEIVLSPRHLEEFVHGMLNELEVTISEQSSDGRRLSLSLPEEARLSLEWPRNHARLTFSRDSNLHQRYEVLDWNSRFLQALLRVAKAPSFGGEVACVSDLPASSLVASTLYWQNSQGKRTRRELSLSLVDSHGQIQVNHPELLEFFLHSQEDASTPDAAERKELFERVVEALNQRLRDVSSLHLHPEGIEYLALAVQGQKP